MRRWGGCRPPNPPRLPPGLARKPQEAESEVRALLDLARENGASVKADLADCQILLQGATSSLTILDPELGGQELIKSVAAGLAKLTALMAENRQRQ